MKTPLHIEDSLLQRLREEAARRGTTMFALAEAGIRRMLAVRDPSENPPETLPPPAWHGGNELVDIANREALRRAMKER